MEKNTMPERINVMRVITYDTARVQEIIHAETEKPFDEITLEEVIARVEEWARDDFACDYGHEINLKDLIWQDENGEEL